MSGHESQLEIAERHMRDGEQRIARQEAFIGRMAQKGHRVSFMTRWFSCKPSGGYSGSTSPYGRFAPSYRP